jgi:tetratricopeptide (TPR) repeat protein
MKLIYIVIFSFLGISSITAQTLKKKADITPSSNPLEINVDLVFDYNADIDTTQISPVMRSKINTIDSLITKENNTSALELLKEINKEENETYYFHFLKGILEFKLDQLNDAYNSIKKTIDLTSNDSLKSSLYYTLGIIDLKRDYPVSSYYNFEKSYKKDSINMATLVILGTLNDKKNAIDKAILFYKKAINIDPTLNNIKNNLAFQYQEKGDHLKAINMFSDIIKEDPKSPLPYSNRSYSYLQLDNTKEALKDVNTSLELFSSNAYAYRNRALIYIYIALNNTNDACDDINKAIELGYVEKYGYDLVLLKNKHCLN